MVLDSCPQCSGCHENTQPCIQNINTKPELELSLSEKKTLANTGIISGDSTKQMI